MIPFPNCSIAYYALNHGEVFSLEHRQGDLFLGILVQPRVDYEHLEEVLILRNPPTGQP